MPIKCKVFSLNGITLVNNNTLVTVETLHCTLRMKLQLCVNIALSEAFPSINKGRKTTKTTKYTKLGIWFVWYCLSSKYGMYRVW